MEGGDGRLCDLKILCDCASGDADRTDQLARRVADLLRSHCGDGVDALEARAASAIRSAFFGGLTYAQLAERDDVPLGTMKTWIRRGLLQLKACLGDG